MRSTVGGVGRLDQPRRRGQRPPARVVAVGVASRRTSSTSTPSTWLTSAHEQVDQLDVGQGDDQLVDGPAAAPLEDLDADHVAAHRADAAGHLAQRARTIGQPDAHDDTVCTAGDGTGRAGHADVTAAVTAPVNRAAATAW